MLVIKAQVKGLTKEYNVSSKFFETLDAKVKELVLGAIARAKANGRKTVMSRDI